LSELAWLAGELALRGVFLACAVLALHGATGWQPDWGAFVAVCAGYALGRIHGLRL
jgi:ABC-type uncharacterized transport system permease subunit